MRFGAARQTPGIQSTGLWYALRQFGGVMVVSRLRTFHRDWLRFGPVYKNARVCSEVISKRLRQRMLPQATMSSRRTM